MVQSFLRNRICSFRFERSNCHCCCLYCWYCLMMVLLLLLLVVVLLLLVLMMMMIMNHRTKPIDLQLDGHSYSYYWDRQTMSGRLNLFPNSFRSHCCCKVFCHSFYFKNGVRGLRDIESEAKQMPRTIGIFLYIRYEYVKCTVYVPSVQKNRFSGPKFPNGQRQQSKRSITAATSINIILSLSDLQKRI